MVLPKTRREHIEGFLVQIDRSKLKREVADTVDSIATQFQTRGDISEAQYEVLRRCSLATCKRSMALNNRWETMFQACRG